MIMILAVILFLCIVKLLTVVTNFQCTASKCLVGKVAIVTGGNAGMGYEYVLDLASRGCKVIIGDISNGEKTVLEIIDKTGNQNIIWKYLDLGSLVSVRNFAADILQTETRLDILINNAGCGGFKGFTEDGLQKLMQINYFGHFLLSHLLVDLLKRTEKSRIVSISSALAFTHVISKAEQMNTEPNISIKLVDVVLQYGNSKLCVLIAMKLMAEKLNKHGILCFSVHPGVIYTGIYNTSFKNSTMGICNHIASNSLMQTLSFLFGKTAREGAQTGLHCALSDEVEDLSGKYFWNGSAFWEPMIVKDRQFCMDIWKKSEQLVQLKDNELLE